MPNALVMFHGHAAPRVFELKKPDIIIGRGEACDLRVPLGSVSRKHCKITIEPDAIVEDLGSSNGTYVNGQRIHSHPLEPGDSIQIGPVVFVLQIDGIPPIRDMSPVRTQSQTVLTSSIDGSHPDSSPTIQTQAIDSPH
jgi:pSer/pThr/pTyr-binding forkhead associated (FHA) protein